MCWHVQQSSFRSLSVPGVVVLVKAMLGGEEGGPQAG